MNFREELAINEKEKSKSGSPSRAPADSVALALATCAGIGRFPFAPGTVGTLVVGVPLCLILQVQPLGLYALSVLAWTVLGLWATDRAESLLKQKDPPSVVLDEVVGFLVTLTGVGVGWLSMTLGFVLFRFFDITKVPPTRWVERKLPGGLGIMADDVVAGIYANISLRVLLGLLN